MKEQFSKIAALLLCSMLSFAATAQTQIVKGQVLDAQSQSPLIGASVVLLDFEPITGSVTDVDGEFRIQEVPIGRQTFAVQYVGYKSITIPNVLVTTGKEVVLNVNLEESVESLNAVVVTADSKKDRPINELAKVSARTFNLEETTRFSGGRNDVARLATSFAGVSAPNDSRNDIVVRGNSPTGLLWRIEGIPVATTNHFSTLGVTGGPVNALNTNMLSTSDFLTGAFPAEYGNANAAVFDINFRDGNADKFEFTGQMSAFSGLEFMVEGPISKRKGSSFVMSYRYGIASLAATGTSATPYYQDLSFKSNFGESKLGRFELFGMGGISSINFKGEEVEENDLFANPSEDAYVKSRLGLLGLSNTIRIDNSTFLKSTLAVSTSQNDYDQDNLLRDTDDVVIGKFRATEVDNEEYRYSFASTLTKKFSARWNAKAGYLGELYNASFNTRDRDNRVEIPDMNNDSIPDYFITVNDMNDAYVLHQLYAQAEYNASDKLSFTAGLHTQLLTLNNRYALEPRLGLSYQITPIQRISFAYGLHAQMLPAPIVFLETQQTDGSSIRTNEDLAFMKAHHWVAGYDLNLGQNWRLKSEFYFQYLFDIPVEQEASSYAVTNEGADFVFEQRPNLINEGTGTNYGIELTLEKFFSDGYYLLATSSLYNSQYKGSDGIQRSTAFNNQFVGNILFGKEWAFGKNKNNAWTFDTKLTTAGGTPYTPVDLDATRDNAGREVRMENEAFSLNYDDYFRWDVKFGVRINSGKRNISHQFFVDLQNVTNRQNEIARRYNEVTDEINSVAQLGFFPDVMYRIQF